MVLNASHSLCVNNKSLIYMALPINIFFNGPPGVGKTALAEHFAKQSKNGALINVDEIRHFQKGGICRNPNEKAFVEQKRLAYVNSKCVIDNFRKNGIETFVADLVMTPDIIDAYLGELGQLENSYHFVLLPDISIAKERNKLRDKWKIMEDDVIEKYYRFAAEISFPADWIIIDTSNQSLEETAKLVRRRMDSAAI